MIEWMGRWINGQVEYRFKMDVWLTAVYIKKWHVCVHMRIYMLCMGTCGRQRLTSEYLQIKWEVRGERGPWGRTDRFTDEPLAHNMPFTDWFAPFNAAWKYPTWIIWFPLHSPSGVLCWLLHCYCSANDETEARRSSCTLFKFKLHLFLLV